MTSSRNRKIAYLLVIVVLFTGLVGLSERIQKAQEDHGLAQKSLGDVDPVSGTAQLVLFGMRGVAVTFLWNQAIELKRKERWFEIRPVIESITLLQPNFINPWRFQAWNMAYNISAEWEAVEDKYFWIRQGIDFMKDAVATNRNICDLQWYVGWIYYNKFGMSDEKQYLRELFKEEEDTSFAQSRSSGIKDNFEVAYDWFTEANETVMRLDQKPRFRGITPFMSYPSMSKGSYANFLGADGFFGERTRNAWRRAYEEWIRFGRGYGHGKAGPNRYDFIHRLEFNSDEWNGVQLFDVPLALADALDNKDLSALRSKFEENGITLSADATVSVEKTGKEWKIQETPDSHYMVFKREDKIDVRRGGLTSEQGFWVQHFAGIVHYNYWKKRCRAEAEPALVAREMLTDEEWKAVNLGEETDPAKTFGMQDAREALHNANEARSEGDYKRALREFERAFPLWRHILRNDDNLRIDMEFQEMCQENEHRYLKLLADLDMPAPEKRPFEGLYDPLPTMPAMPAGARDLQRPDQPETQPEGPTVLPPESQ